MDAQFLADLDFDWQAVRIPAGLALAEVSAHGLVAGKKILDRPGQAMARMRQTIGRGRSFVKHERGCTSPNNQGFFVNTPIFPELDNFFFKLWKGNGTGYGLEHGINNSLQQSAISNQLSASSVYLSA
jgi:hypothetical protein